MIQNNVSKDLRIVLFFFELFSFHFIFFFFRVLFFFLFFYFISTSSTTKKIKYGVMVDAGSAGTRAHIFTWAKKDVSIKMRPTSKNHSECIYKSNIPLSAAKDNISVINSIFDPMVRFLIDHIPQTEMPKTKVYVFATAGLRMLDFSQQAAILEKTYKRLKKSPFNIQRKNIMSTRRRRPLRLWI